MRHRRDGARFSTDMTLGNQAKEFTLGVIRPENLVSHGLSPLGAFWQTPSEVSFMEATVFLGTFNAAEYFCYHSLDLCLDKILSRSSMDNSFDLMSWFLL